MVKKKKEDDEDLLDHAVEGAKYLPGIGGALTMATETGDVIQRGAEAQRIFDVVASNLGESEIELKRKSKLLAVMMDANDEAAGHAHNSATLLAGKAVKYVGEKTYKVAAKELADPDQLNELQAVMDAREVTPEMMLDLMQAKALLKGDHQRLEGARATDSYVDDIILSGNYLGNLIENDPEKNTKESVAEFLAHNDETVLQYLARKCSPTVDDQGVEQPPELDKTVLFLDKPVWQAPRTAEASAEMAMDEGREGEQADMVSANEEPSITKQVAETGYTVPSDAEIRAQSTPVAPKGKSKGKHDGKHTGNFSTVA